MVPAIEPFLSDRTVIVVAHEPVLLPHFDAVIQLGAHPTVAAS
jgi:ABC-type transport system involved in cytochrome bd biosynthesis fused ATPase/permease subunit